MDSPWGRKESDTTERLSLSLRQSSSLFWLEVEKRFVEGTSEPRGQMKGAWSEMRIINLEATITEQEEPMKIPEA